MYQSNPTSLPSFFWLYLIRIKIWFIISIKNKQHYTNKAIDNFVKQNLGKKLCSPFGATAQNLGYNLNKKQSFNKGDSLGQAKKKLAKKKDVCLSTNALEI